MTDLSTDPLVVLNSGANNLSIGQEFSFSVASELADGAAYAVDDIVSFGCHERTLFKGVIKTVERSLNGENVNYGCQGAEQFLEGLPWLAKHENYNPPEFTCGDTMYEATIGDFIEQEWNTDAGYLFTSQLPDWFTSIEIPPSVAALTAGATTTIQKSFLSALQAVIAPYPHVQLTIEYSAESGGSIFPVGKLVIVDTMAGRANVDIEVGTSTPPKLQASDLSVREETVDSAETINVYGRGSFTERGEVLKPAWDPAEENIIVTKTLTVTTPDPYTPTLTFSYFDFGDVLDIISQPEIRVDGLLAFEQADYTLDYTNGRISWNDFATIVNATTGSVRSDLPPGPGIGERYPFAKNQAHVAKTITMMFKKLGPNAYRRYRTLRNIGDVRLKIGRVIDPESADINNPDWIDRAIPDVLPSFYAVRPLVTDSIWKLLDPAERAALIQSPYTLPIFPGAVDGSNKPYIFGPTDGTVVVTRRDGFFIPLEEATFTEGGKCVTFAKRQLGYMTMGPAPIINADLLPGQGVTFEQAYRPELVSDIYSWEIAVRYTSWEDWKVTRTSTKGRFKVLNVVLDSALKYTDYAGNVLQDDTARIEEAADEAKAYSDTPNTTGSAEIILSLNASTKYEIPVRVGDKILLSGNVNAVFTSLAIIVNQIDFSRINSGVVSLGFGRKEPRKNPFAPRKPPIVDLEGYSREPAEISGLEVR